MSSIGMVKRFADGLVQDVGHVSEIKVNEVRGLLEGDYMSFDVRIGASLPILVFKIIPSIKLVEAVDQRICKMLEYFGAIDYANIHVIEVTKAGG